MTTGRILWLTGLPGSGKTTLARAVRDRILPHPIILDGDELRAGLSADLAFTDADRHEQCRRASEIAVLLACQGHTVIVALVSPFYADRVAAAELAAKWGVAIAGCYLECSADVREARCGRAYECPYERTTISRHILQTDTQPVGECVDQLVAVLLELRG